VNEKEKLQPVSHTQICVKLLKRTARTLNQLHGSGSDWVHLEYNPYMLLIALWSWLPHI